MKTILINTQMARGLPMMFSLPCILILLSLCSGCVFPLGERAEIGIDPFQARADERRVKHYQRQGLSEEEAQQQVFEDRFIEKIEQDRWAERRQRHRDNQGQRDFERHFRETMEGAGAGGGP